MALTVDPNQPVRFVPFDQLLIDDESRRTAYLLKPPTVWDRIEFQKAVFARGGVPAGELDVLGALRDGVLQIYGAHESAGRDGLLAQIDEVVASRRALNGKILSGAYAGDGGAAAFAEDNRRHLARIEALAEVADLVAEGYPRYARLRSAAAAYPLIRGAVAARKFLLGWENPPGGLAAGDFARDPNGVREELLLRLPDHHLVAIGEEIERLLHPTETERKNSASPSPGAATPAPSTAENATTTTTP